MSYSSDAGTTWTPWNEGFLNRVASRLCVHDGQLWSSMTSDGVWKRSLSELAPISILQPELIMPLSKLTFASPFPSDTFLQKPAGDIKTHDIHLTVSTFAKNFILSLKL